MKSWTNKTALDHVRRYFLEEGNRPGYTGIDECVYRTPEGDRCAIGCLIPDELWQPELDDLRLEGVIEKYEDLFRDCTKQFLEKLQCAHDESASMPEFQRELKERLDALEAEAEWSDA